jgi:hypothetical protein
VNRAVFKSTRALFQALPANFTLSAADLSVFPGANFSIPLAKNLPKKSASVFPVAPPELISRPAKTALHGKVMKL